MYENKIILCCGEQRAVWTIENVVRQSTKEILSVGIDDKLSVRYIWGLKRQYLDFWVTGVAS